MRELDSTARDDISLDEVQEVNLPKFQTVLFNKNNAHINVQS
jgi:hypothetical protein